MAKNLVIVESPAKAKTIEKFLGKDFVVKSSFGHIRDLPSKDMSIDIENDFQPKYVVSEDKGKVVSELKKEVQKADMVWLASDEDREGEAIAWHLKETLGLEPEKTKRIVFNEITKNAILNAVENPRDIDINLVNAQQARRVLDRIVGYEISPVLWKKVKPALSAGRVQSVAVRLIVEKETEIQNFKQHTLYKVKAAFLTNEGKHIFTTLDQKFETKEETLKFLNDCKEAIFSVEAIETKPSKTSPSAPFTTSTLQQEASKRLGMSVSRTMSVAQNLYEEGYITYMRTDSVNLSDLALAQAKEVIESEYGKEYLKIRKFSNKIKGAQEAHEAIRPTDLSRKEIIAEPSAQRLYDLIRKRTLASQMADAKLEKTNITIAISNREEKHIANGEVVLFDGFMKVYAPNKEEDSTEEKESTSILPRVNQGEFLEHLYSKAQESHSTPPARYNEAMLVKKLEDLGIGRPSTYAPTITTIQKREYVNKQDNPAQQREIVVLFLENGNINEQQEQENFGSEKGKLHPTDIGTIVNNFLVEHFTDIIDYNFTAQVEKQFDKIAQGDESWQDMMKEFYTPFHKEVEATKESKKESGERLLGIDNASGKNVYAKIGRFGAMIQIGEISDEEKPRFASLKKTQSINTITLEEALDLFRLPRIVGILNEHEIVANNGRFGAYISYNAKNYTLPKGIDPMEVSFEECVEVIEKKDKQTELVGKVLATKDGKDITLAYGRYGMYIKYDENNFRIPRGVNAGEITAEQAIAIVSGETKKQEAIKTFACGAELLEGRYGVYIKYNGKNYKIPKENKAEELDDKIVEQIVNQPVVEKKTTSRRKK
ncbi:MAG: type I DNA topoisomerase [Bacteroidales bacterium]|nr:type I DNA topoisomerase [Bacteroidales bacterium]